MVSTHFRFRIVYTVDTKMLKMIRKTPCEDADEAWIEFLSKRYRDCRVLSVFEEHNRVRFPLQQENGESIHSGERFQTFRVW